MDHRHQLMVEFAAVHEIQKVEDLEDKKTQGVEISHLDH
jgi:hypothetical protein